MRLLPLAALLAAAALVLAAPAAARPGDVDRTFGTGGGYAHPFVADGRGIAERANGRLLVPSGGGAVQLTRAGRLDRGFGDGGEVSFDPDAGVIDGALDRAGRTLLLTTDADGDSGLEVVRLRRDGRPDRSFGPEGRRPVQGVGRRFSPLGLALDRRNRLVLSASARLGGRTRVVVARLRASGRPDPAFGTGGFVVGARGKPFGRPLVQGSRIIVPVRPFAPRGRRVVQALFAYRTDGRPSRGYGRRGRARLIVGARRFGGVPRVAAGPGRSVVVVGEINSRRQAERASLYVARLGRSGRVDRRFARRGLARLYRRGRVLAPAAVTTDARGRALVAANDAYPDQVTVFRLRRDGRPDRRFGRRGAVRTLLGGRPDFAVLASEASEISAGRRGRIYVAGAAYDDEVEFRDDFGAAHLAITALRGR